MAAPIKYHGYKLKGRAVIGLFQYIKYFNTSNKFSCHKRTLCTTMRLYDRDMYWNDKSVANESKFEKILIANRGEIACRVIKTCKRLGIKTVAVHSEVDSLALHTRMADEAICIGPAQTSESYLRMDKILNAVKESGAQAVHPGYGFLSENTEFAAKLDEIGVAFIGPNSKAIKAMGDKIESKRIATKAQVNMIPGFDGVVEDAEHCVKLSNQIVCLSWASTKHNAITVHVISGSCKVHHLHSTTGKTKCERPYGSFTFSFPGTVEFLVDKNKNFYFLEMNTRLQVEHPITEMITGVDIVHQMLRVAKNHKLLHEQKDIPVDGWAIECRVYAEDPYKSFGMPSIGRLSRYVEPTHLKNTRCDSGIMEGSDISIYYDPMICKLVTYGRDRTAAMDNMIQALDSYVIKGVTHNIPLLRDILTEERFVKGDISTNYLPEVFPDGFKGKVLSVKESQELTALACAIYLKDQQRCRAFQNQKRIPNVSSSINSWSLNVIINKARINAHASKLPDGYKIVINSDVYEIKGNLSFTSPLMEVCLNGDQRLLQVHNRLGGGKYDLRYHGTVYPVKVMDDLAFNLSQYMLEKKVLDTSAMVLAPMPGLLKSVSVKAGDMVAENQEVCVLEAMKMQNSLVSLKVAKVKKVLFKSGDTVNEGDVIVELE
uniref:propionyl-CoA carboxylase n=1 Tax=Biomphalaria glabrata TaxID=6526 RepID=A0A2C9K9Y5_BIOGL